MVSQRFSKMEPDDFQKPYKQRFKGVENFLRRVAFNLGNTASQTEVKIVSCIPIDVTDLQQKIISLERQLHEANEIASAGAVPDSAPTDPGTVPAPSTSPPAPAPTENVPENPENNPNNNNNKPSTAVNSAPRKGSAFGKGNSTVSYCTNRPSDQVRSSQFGLYSGGGSSRIRKSNVSFVFPALTTPNNKNECKFAVRENYNINSSGIERYKNIFRKQKRKKCCEGSNKVKTHLVYYAHHTADNPFRITDDSLKYNDTITSNDELCISYLNKIIRRQYDPNEVVEEFSNTSNFSRPICRDVGNTHTNRSKYEYDTDVCSCCHDKFRNIDHYVTKGDYESIITKLHKSVHNTSSYYDSNHYDVIPVKENSNKTLKNNNEQKLESETSVEIKCWPEHLRTKQKCQPYFYNYQTETPVKRRSNKILQDMMLKGTNQSGKLHKKRENTRVPNQQTGSITSKSCYIDCSDVYPKQCPQPKSRKIENLVAKSQKHESVATDEVINELNVNNQSTQLDMNKVEDNRELTLNQIKTILQSVLNEVKMGTKSNNNPDEVIKKDAVVQKGASQNSMPGDSTFLHSYTYNNSYNTNPHLASCSKQTPQGQYCVTGVPFQPLKCLQNYPVFIQPAAGRHMCACYYKKNSYKPHMKHAMTAATNTDDKQISSSSETEKLIKEIYKSMAINMDFPTRDSSKSECNDRKPSDKFSSNTIELKNVGVSNKIDVKVDAKVSPIHSYLSQTKAGYESVDAQSEDRKQEIDFNNNDRYSERERLKFHSVQSSDTIVEAENETDDSSDDSDSIQTLVLEENRKTKKGFFNRMLKSVNLFKKKKEMPAEKVASDSDDYETVYSEKSANVSPKRYKKVKERTPYDRARTKRSPYLEQEYRRHWNEELAFREQRESKCSSEHPYFAHSNQIPTRPLYWTDLEARNASVHYKIPNQYRMKDATDQMDIGVQQNAVKTGKTKDKLGWLKKHKLGINCGEQWKRFILES